MKKAISVFNYLAPVPLIVMLASNIAPKGNDPRGYGPAFAVGMVSFLISGIFAVVGIALILIALRGQKKVGFTAIATVISSVPLAILSFSILTGRA